VRREGGGGGAANVARMTHRPIPPFPSPPPSHLPSRHTLTPLRYDALEDYWSNTDMEIVCVFEAIDPLMSGSFQSLQSYTVNDIAFGGEFAPCVVAEKGSTAAKSTSRPSTCAAEQRVCDLAGRRGGSGGLPPTAHDSARFCRRARSPTTTNLFLSARSLARPPARSQVRPLPRNHLPQRRRVLRDGAGLGIATSG
jgi:hypothetical protein